MFKDATWRITLLSSNANNGTNAEEFYWNLNNASGIVYATISGRLSY